MNCPPHQIWFGWSNQKELDGRDMWHISEAGEVHKVTVGRPEWKRSFGRLGIRWEDNIKMDLKEVEWEGLDCIDLAQDWDSWRAVVNAGTNLWVP